MDAFSWMTSLSVWLAFSMTFFLVSSRVMLLWLLRLYKYEQIHPTTWYLIILILLEVPLFINFIHILWNTPVICAVSRKTLPKVSYMALGVMSSALESVATSIFATEVAHVLPEPVLLTLSFSVLIFILLKDIRKQLQNQSENRSQFSCPMSLQYCIWSLISLLPFCFMFLAITAVSVVLCTGSNFELSPERCIVLGICILLLSSTWNPTVQKLVVLSEKTRSRCITVDLLYIPVKIVSLAVSIFLSLFFQLLDFRTHIKDCTATALHELSDARVWFPVIINCLGSFLCLMSATAASKVGLITPGVKIPMLLCPPLTILVTAVLWNDFETQAFWEVAGEDIYSWIANGLSAVIWLIPFMLHDFHGFRNPKITNRDVSECFYSFSWSPFFLEARCILNHEPNYISKKLQDALSSQITNLHKKRIVFICTTMYKESKKEMKRYLRSLQNVFINNDKRNIHIEAHVFFDSSIINDQINSRGQHLLSVLCSIFQIDHNDLEKAATPYGCQIHIRVLGNYSMYIHFKDATKVKAKKRWSQVMYMHYVLQFRTSSITQPETDKHFLLHSDSVRQFKENVINFESDLNFHDTSPVNFPSTTVNSPFPNYCNDSVISTNDISYTAQKSQAFVTENIYAVKDMKYSFCHDSSLNAMSLYSQQTSFNKKENNSAQVLASFCKSDASFTMPTDYSDLGTITEGIGLRHSSSRKSSFSTDISDHDCTSSSGIYSTKTDSSLETTSGKMISEINNKAISTPLDGVFLLTTDADTEFSAKSIMHLLEECEAEGSVGAVCGRTVPVGSSKPIVWYQKFEYAKDFWLVKSSQNVIGSVTCCPGCFSIYRGSALATIAEEFSQPVSSAFDSLVMDHGEDRWLCTLLMQNGWRLAYSSHAHNSTYCPGTVGEFLRQRRRWVLSELSNMTAIFMSIQNLMQNNSSFSGMFLISLFTTFLWVILAPSTTLVFMSAGMEVLFSVPLATTMPVAVSLFIGYYVICCFASQRQQKFVSLVITFSMALIVAALGVGFIMYVVQAIQSDLQMWGSVQFRPYFLVFILVIAIVYAALLHPREIYSLVYGLAYALLFPAMFVILPVYALSNMTDQSWGTRESGSHGCCQQPDEDEDDHAFNDFTTIVSSLPRLTSYDKESENIFWKHLLARYIGKNANTGKSTDALSHELRCLRRASTMMFMAINLVWFPCLSVMYTYARSDIISYCVVAVFSFSLLVQLIGLSCYKCNSFFKRYLINKCSSINQRSKF